jgi:hypothetical protein
MLKSYILRYYLLPTIEHMKTHGRGECVTLVLVEKLLQILSISSDSSLEPL